MNKPLLKKMDTPLFRAAILQKSITEDANGDWNFAGIASDESMDAEGDTILRKHIDLTYAQERGYANWEHSREPADQIGYLTKAQVIGPNAIEELRKSFPEVGETASVYVEGKLYKHVPKAADVLNLLKSSTGTVGIGLSLDGAVARNKETKDVLKAYVRGVAFTAMPAHTKTLVQLRKSLVDGIEELDLATEVANKVIEALKKNTAEPVYLEHDQAVFRVLQLRPKWTYELAKKVVQYTLETKGANQ